MSHSSQSTEMDFAKRAERAMRERLEAGGKIDSPYWDRREDMVWKAGYLTALKDVSEHFKVGWR